MKLVFYSAHLRVMYILSVSLIQCFSAIFNRTSTPLLFTLLHDSLFCFEKKLLVGRVINIA